MPVVGDLKIFLSTLH